MNLHPGANLGPAGRYELVIAIEEGMTLRSEPSLPLMEM
jgi:hypothetical protein